SDAARPSRSPAGDSRSGNLSRQCSLKLRDRHDPVDGRRLRGLVTNAGEKLKTPDPFFLRQSLLSVRMFSARVFSVIPTVGCRSGGIAPCLQSAFADSRSLRRSFILPRLAQVLKHRVQRSDQREFLAPAPAF